jgi:hypothetical protein
VTGGWEEGPTRWGQVGGGTHQVVPGGPGGGAGRLHQGELLQGQALGFVLTDCRLHTALLTTNSIFGSCQFTSSLSMATSSALAPGAQ